jgi:epsilon-lactone hydrolase
MASPQFEKLVNLIRSNKQPPGDHPVEKLRAGMERASLPAADDITATAVDAGGVPAEWVSAPGADAARVVLYLHGGGYVMGSPVTHRKLAGDVSRASGARVLLIDYRLAPEHPMPAAIDDAVRAYRWLLQDVAPGSIAVAGDSAGGGLTVATLLALRDAGDPMPGAAVCISPWVDFTGEAASIQSRAERDPMVGIGDLSRFGAWYLAGADPRASSPAYADLQGLPPLLIHVGDDEIILDDSVLLNERATAAGVDATLEVWPEMFHVWHVFAGRVPESTAAVERVGAFLQDRLGASQPA